MMRLWFLLVFISLWLPVGGFIVSSSFKRHVSLSFIESKGLEFGFPSKLWGRKLGDISMESGDDELSKKRKGKKESRRHNKLLGNHVHDELNTERDGKTPGSSSSSADVDNGNSLDIEVTRSALAAIIEESWSRVTQLVPAHVLSQCEEELKAATSLLVLATIRKAADFSPSARLTVEGMFREADVNNDGHITFLEWFEWLGRTATSVNFNTVSPESTNEYDVNHSNASDGSDSDNGEQLRSRRTKRRDKVDSRRAAARVQSQYEARQSAKDRRLQQVDPLVTGLSQVLGHAVCALQIAARLPNDDPSYLSAAFISGGIMARVMDDELVKNMLVRLSPRTRDMVAVALALEASSMASEVVTSTSSVIFDQIDAARVKAFDGAEQTLEVELDSDLDVDVDIEAGFRDAVDLSGGTSYGTHARTMSSDPESIISTSKDVSTTSSTNTVLPLEDIVQNVDLSSIPIATAPAIDDEEGNAVPDATEHSNAYVQGLYGSPDVGEIEDGDADAVLEVELIDDGNEQKNSWAVEDEAMLSQDGNTVVEVDDIVNIYSRSGEAETVHATLEESTDHVVDTETYGVFAKGGVGANLGAMDVASTVEVIQTIATAPPEKVEKVIILGEEGEGSRVDVHSLTSGLSSSSYNKEASSEVMEVDVFSPTSTSTYIADTKMDGVEPVSSQPYTSVEESGSPSYGLVLGRDDNLNSTLSKVNDIASDIARLRSMFKELDDTQAMCMRQAILKKSGGRPDILGLSMALRATRLQHTSALGVAAKHKLAMETLQLWAPISFQIGVASLVPELEVHSYVLLFPKSFASFINWYTQFRPIARKILAKFRRDVEDIVKADTELARMASRITIQSRFKSPSSAFKKMVKSSKQKHELHDMLGVRLIIEERTQKSNKEVIARTGTGHVYDDGINAVRYGDDFDYEIEVVDDFNGKYNEGSDDDDDREGTEERDYIDATYADMDDEERFFRQVYDDDDESDNSNGDSPSNGEVVIETPLFAEVYPSSSTDPLWSTPTPASNEQTMVMSIRDVVRVLGDWSEDMKRYKDYVTYPKPSGYRSVHMTLRHKECGINLEVQIRSKDMHLEAEYGRASHSNYKALALPASINRAT